MATEMRDRLIHCGDGWHDDDVLARTNTDESLNQAEKVWSYLLLLPIYPNTHELPTSSDFSLGERYKWTGVRTHTINLDRNYFRNRSIKKSQVCQCCPRSDYKVKQHSSNKQHLDILLINSYLEYHNRGVVFCVEEARACRMQQLSFSRPLSISRLFEARKTSKTNQLQDQKNRRRSPPPRRALYLHAHKFTTSS